MPELRFVGGEEGVVCGMVFDVKDCVCTVRCFVDERVVKTVTVFLKF